MFWRVISVYTPKLTWTIYFVRIHIKLNATVCVLLNVTRCHLCLNFFNSKSDKQPKMTALIACTVKMISVLLYSVLSSGTRSKKKIAFSVSRMSCTLIASINLICWQCLVLDKFSQGMVHDRSSSKVFFSSSNITFLLHLIRARRWHFNQNAN